MLISEGSSSSSKPDRSNDSSSSSPSSSPPTLIDSVGSSSSSSSEPLKSIGPSSSSPNSSAGSSSHIVFIASSLGQPRGTRSGGHNMSRSTALVVSDPGRPLRVFADPAAVRATESNSRSAQRIRYRLD